MIANKQENNIKYFSGISTPAAAGLTLLPMMLNFRFNVEFFLNEYFIKFYLLIPSILMISNVKNHTNHIRLVITKIYF